MSMIWIFGNVIKDVYLEVDGKDFEKDEEGVSWLELGFHGSKHFFSERTSILGGAMVVKDVLEKFGLEAEIANYDDRVEGETEYRYILCKDDGIAYFAGERRLLTEYVEPYDAGLIYIDRTAGITNNFVRELKKYKETHPRVPIIVHLPKEPSEGMKKIAEMSNIVFSEAEVPEEMRRKTCFLDSDGIKFLDREEKWEITRGDQMTHLTIFSTAAATVVAAILNKINARDALAMAKVNATHAKLDGSLYPDEIENIVATERDSEADLRQIAKMLVSHGRGILAADESGGSIHKKFQKMGIVDDEKHRREYRNIFFTTDELEKYVNGVILFDETARQKADDGRNFVDFLTSRGVIPGVKVDLGLVNFTNSEEKYTAGLEGLRERLTEYYKMGLRFAKWRAAFEITETTPSEFAIRENAKILARYAKICQEERIVPIVEPEVVYDGNYSLSRSKEVTGKVLEEVFSALKEENVDISATILKVNMIIAGKQFPTQSTPEEVGRATVEVLGKYVPKEIAGVVFLSGGQTVTQATENLREVTKNSTLPFPVTFSFARALQEPALEAWRGDGSPEVLKAAREEFRLRLIENCKALKKS